MTDKQRIQILRKHWSAIGEAINRQNIAAKILVNARSDRADILAVTNWTGRDETIAKEIKREVKQQEEDSAEGERAEQSEDYDDEDDNDQEPGHDPGF